MPKLRISKLVQPSRSLDREITPNILIRSKREFLNSSTVGFETLVRILSSDPARQTVTVGFRGVPGVVKVYGVHPEGGFFVHHPDISDTV